MRNTDKNTHDAAAPETYKVFGPDAELSSHGEHDLMNMLREGRHSAYRTLRCLGVTIGVRVHREKT
ncbi:MAG: hypothetical protein QNJ61_03740 [Desulfobacterales bacterium]|nr:hypothetical protein [Desulfobacterales bacterium]